MIDPHEIFGDEPDELDDAEYLYEDDQWEDDYIWSDDEVNNENPCY